LACVFALVAARHGQERRATTSGVGVKRRLVACVAVALGVVTVGGGVAAATSSPRANAQATGEGFIATYLYASTHGGALNNGNLLGEICGTKTQSGFFTKNSAYLASCESSDGTLQIFAIVNAKKGAPLALNSPYLVARLHMLCIAGGAAYAEGVKGRYLHIFAGTDGNVSGAKDLRNLRALGCRACPVPRRPKCPAKRAGALSTWPS
jgi:hypothetical protein